MKKEKGVFQPPPVLEDQEEVPLEKSFKHAYHFGEIVDSKDRTMDYFMCPSCGFNKKSMKLVEDGGKIKTLFECPTGHQWLLNSETSEIENPEARKFEFPEK